MTVLTAPDRAAEAQAATKRLALGGCVICALEPTNYTQARFPRPSVPSSQPSCVVHFFDAAR